MKITLINCDSCRSNTNEDLLHQEITQRGHQLDIKSWNDVSSEEACDVAVIRLTWDYVERISEFRAWMSRMSEAKFPVLNSLKTIEWNLEKSYLLELERKGIAIPKSYLWTGKYLPNFITLEETLGPPPYVFKPIVSAGARGTFLVQGDVSYSAAIDRMRRAPFLAQEYLREVKKGELSIVLFDGAYSHAVRKVPQSGDFRVQAEHGGRVETYEPSKDEISWAQRAWSLAPERPLIARVDYVLTNGAPVLMELEVFEPELFFDHAPKGAAQLAKAIESRAR